MSLSVWQYIVEFLLEHICARLPHLVLPTYLFLRELTTSLRDNRAILHHRKAFTLSF